MKRLLLGEMSSLSEAIFSGKSHLKLVDKKPFERRKASLEFGVGWHTNLHLCGIAHAEKPIVDYFSSERGYTKVINEPINEALPKSPIFRKGNSQYIIHTSREDDRYVVDIFKKNVGRERTIWETIRDGLVA